MSLTEDKKDENDSEVLESLLKDDDEIFEDAIRKDFETEPKDDIDFGAKLTKLRDQNTELRDEVHTETQKRRLKKRKHSRIVESENEDLMDIELFDASDAEEKSDTAPAKEPPLKKHRPAAVAKMSPGETLMPTGSIGFDDDDFGSNDSDADANLSVKTPVVSALDKRKQAIEALKTGKTPNRVPTNVLKSATGLDGEAVSPVAERPKREHVARVYEGWPILAGKTEELHVRCTYATRESWSPFEGRDAPIAQYSPMKQSVWGIFVPHHIIQPSLSERKEAAAAANEDSLDEVDADAADSGISEDNSSAARAFEAFAKSTSSSEPLLQKCPWFVIVGEDALMKTITSPMFANRVRLVAVDPAAIVFNLNRRAPVFYAYEVVEKHPLWPDTMHFSWRLNDLRRLLVDTIYAHMDALTNGVSKTDALGRLLLGATNFAIHKNPALQLLPPSAVSLNGFSERRERSDAIKSRIDKKRVTENTMEKASIEGIPVVDCHSLIASGMTNNELLFSELEKPPSAWQLLERGVPIDVISAISRWDTHDSHMVRARFSLVATLYAKSWKELKRDELVNLASFVRLDPAWFADWYNLIEQDGLITDVASLMENRLSIYSVFCTGAAWHAYMNGKLKYGANHTFLYTAQQRNEWFEKGRHELSQTREISQSLDNPTAINQPPTPLDATTIATLRDMIDDNLNILCSDLATNTIKTTTNLQAVRNVLGGGASRRPLFTTLASGTKVLVERAVQERCTTLGKLFFEVCLRWKTKAKSSCGLAEPFNTLPPVLVQNAFLYGSARASSTSAMYAQLKRAVESLKGPTKSSMVVIRASDDPAQVKSLLARERKGLYLVVFDGLHAWSENLIDTVVGELTQTGAVSDCTHLVVTLHAQSLTDMTSTGLFIDDMIEFGQTMQRRLKLNTEGDSGGHGLLLTSATNTRFLERGLATEMAYPIAMRNEQFEINTAKDMLQCDKSFNDLLIKHASDTSVHVPGARASILVLYALKTTETHIHRILKNLFQAAYAKQVTLVSYEDLARRPSVVSGGRKIVVFCDLHYKGAGRPTAQHLNAGFERTNHAIHVLQTTTVDFAKPIQHEKARSLLNAVFFTNDEKSDRLATQTQRLSLLKKKLDSYMYNTKMVALFDE